MTETPPRLRTIFDKLLDADVRTRERILDDVHRDDPGAAKRLRAMIAQSPGPASTLGLWNKLPADFAAIPVLVEGDRVDDFRVSAPLGVGGLATVYLAVDERLGRRVALKVSRSTGIEPQLLAKLAHPGIVQAYRAFRDSTRGVDVLVLQYVEGLTLEEALAEKCFCGGDAGYCLNARLENRLGSRASDGLDRDEATRKLRGLDTTTLALRIATEIAEALSFAHGRGVLHLDLKPSNIFIDRGGHAILGDFNVSMEEGRGRSLGGTPGYMSPEQLGTKPVDARSDVFSLGRLVARIFTQVPASCLPSGLESWIWWTTESEPSQRPVDVATAAESLREIARWHAVSAQSAATDSRFLAWVRRRPMAATFIATIVPNAIMSAIQILYNRIHIVDLATPAQQSIFRSIVGPWNVFVFSAAGYLLWRRFAPIRTLAPMAAMRRSMQNVFIGGAIASVGWLMGCTLFVSTMALGAPPLASALIQHFVVSFVFAAALCASYAAQGIAFVTAVAWLPSRYHPERGCVVQQAREEANRLRSAVRFLTTTCAALPLASAAVIVWEGPGMMTAGKTQYPFQALVLLALVFSCIGFAMAGRLATYANRALTRLAPQ